MGEHWQHTVCDLHSEYGIDLADPEIAYGRTWGWLATRILGLLVKPGTRLSRALTPVNEAEVTA